MALTPGLVEARSGWHILGKCILAKISTITKRVKQQLLTRVSPAKQRLHQVMGQMASAATEASPP